MNDELRLDLLRLLQVGEANAITASSLSESLGLDDGITSETVRLELIKPMIEENGIPIGSCSKGYFILETKEELSASVDDLNRRIRGMENRKRGLRRGWLKFKGKKPRKIEEV
jgi:hypothetical protein